MQEPKSKWKPWHKWTIGTLAVLIFLLLLIPKDDNKAPTLVLTTPVDSVAVRKDKVEKMFSAFDGSNRKLIVVTKESMNDPESFEHIKTVYWDHDSIIVVKMDYTGKNGFGGRVRGTVMANCNLDGEVLKIIASK